VSRTATSDLDIATELILEGEFDSPAVEQGLDVIDAHDRLAIVSKNTDPRAPLR
jgi:hypothetical protein